jgi:hypothetical protein
MEVNEFAVLCSDSMMREMCSLSTTPQSRSKMPLSASSPKRSIMPYERLALAITGYPIMFDLPQA